MSLRRLFWGTLTKATVPKRSFVLTYRDLASILSGVLKQLHYFRGIEEQKL